MARYFYGADTYGARDALATLKDEKKAVLRWVDKEDLATKSLNEALSVQHGFFGPVLVVMRDPSQLSASDQENLIALIKKENESAPQTILWDRHKPDKRSKLWQAVKAVATEFADLDDEVLTKWLFEQARQRGGILASDAAAVMLARLGKNRWKLSTELDRLLLLNKQVTRVLVEENIEGNYQAEIFSTLDALVAKNKAVAMTNIESLLAGGNSEFFIMSMLAYQFRILLQIRAGLDANLSIGQIAAEGALHPYPVQKNMPIAKQKPESFWRECLIKIMATEVAIKKGTVNARTGLIMLVIGFLK